MLLEQSYLLVPDSAFWLQLGVIILSKQYVSCVATAEDIFQHPGKVAESIEEKCHAWTRTIPHEGSLSVQVDQHLVKMMNLTNVCSNTLDKRAASFAVDAQ